MNEPNRPAVSDELLAGRPWPRRPGRVLLAALLLATLAVSELAVSGCGKNEGSRPPESTGASPPAASRETETAAAPAQANPARSDASGDFKILEGKWLRGDGGYVVEIRRAERDGKLDAAYFNPSPIRVVKAEAKKQGGLVQVFIELRDQGYPGCTYNVVYDAGNDCLAGTYFQAAMRETFPVVFTRAR